MHDSIDREEKINYSEKHTYHDIADKFGLFQWSKKKVNTLARNEGQYSLEQQQRKDMIEGIISKPNAIRRNIIVIFKTNQLISIIMKNFPAFHWLIINDRIINAQH